MEYFSQYFPFTNWTRMFIMLYLPQLGKIQKINRSLTITNKTESAQYKCYLEWMNEWPFIPIHTYVNVQGKSFLKRKAYNDIYSGNYWC